MNERTNMTTGIDRHTEPAVTQAVRLPAPATPRAKNTTAAKAMAEVSLIANERPRLLASISAAVSLAVFSMGPEIVVSVIARIRNADPGTIRSYSPRSAGAGSGALQAKPTISVSTLIDSADWMSLGSSGSLPRWPSLRSARPA